MKILSICSARPNFVKLAAVQHALAARTDFDGQHVIVHTGQHHDPFFSDVFFQELGIPLPNANLGIHGGSNEEQQARVEEACGALFQTEKPDMVIVYGDVNGAAAAARAAHGLKIPIAHVEAGLRSFDPTMPEEKNRIEIDKLASLLFVTEQSGVDNLKKEGITTGVHLVGNTMIDTLIRMLNTIKYHSDAGISVPSRYGIVTLHRPHNVDDPDTLRSIITFLSDLSAHIPLLFPVHLRTKQRLEDMGLLDSLPPTIHCLPPLPYLEFMRLVLDARFVLTDSGGIQEETTYLRKKCFTARPTTERPVTVEIGSNTLVDLSKKKDQQLVIDWSKGEEQIESAIPPLWDGKAGERICDILIA